MSQPMTQNALVGSMGGRAHSLLGYVRSLPNSVWRNIVIVLAGIWMVRNLAALFWLVFPAPDVPAPTKLAAPIESGTKVATTSVSYESIEGLKGIFGNPNEVVVKEPVATPPPQQTEKVEKNTKLRLKLHGVFASNDPRKGSAIIAEGNDQVLYSIGEEIEKNRGVKLAKVFQKRVVLDNKGTMENLWLFSEEDLKSAALASPPKKEETEEAKPNPNVPPSRAVQTTARPDQIPKNIGDVVRFSVHREGGKMVGYRIRPGRDRELFNQVGLKANDIVTSVNGIEVNDPKQIRSVYKSMKTATEAQLTVLRDGVTHSITISLDSGA